MRQPNQRLKLTTRGGRLKGKGSILSAAATGRSLSAIRWAAAPAMDLKCWVINGLFLIGFVAAVASYFVGLAAHRERAPGAPPFSQWRMGWDLYRPQLFTPAGNILRRRSLRLSWVGTGCLLCSIALIFVLRGNELGICWFAS
jgi:hypothetical protein